MKNNYVAKHSRKYNMAAVHKDRKKEEKKNPQFDEEDFCECARKGFLSCTKPCDQWEE